MDKPVVTVTVSAAFLFGAVIGYYYCKTRGGLKPCVSSNPPIENHTQVSRHRDELRNAQSYRDRDDNLDSVPSSPRSTASVSRSESLTLYRSTSFGSTSDGLHERYKMVFIVRMDLRMGKGKIAQQCAHACLGMFKKLYKRRHPDLRLWEENGAVKVALRAETEEQFVAAQAAARAVHLPTHTVIDGGRSQITPYTRTVMAIGPGLSEVVNQVTASYKLL